ncbi:hypothetical protein F8388_015349 [Cannabis sativa]|uniref:Uncharacterized protein n=1 Tax=Cannabis sativa TaxID=3483 RepID=A0A7J6HGD0_CANSA|nr:hypothetical protein F8388_015349 [Cannabis sativa]KAF4394324.1 hypothetical protein G4B88_018474 [Cannabis sativa]
MVFLAFWCPDTFSKVHRHLWRLDLDGARSGLTLSTLPLPAYSQGVFLVDCGLSLSLCQLLTSSLYKRGRCEH